MHEEKQQLRREIARQKKLYSSEQLQAWSDQLMSLLEQTELFRQAHAVASGRLMPLLVIMLCREKYRRLLF